MMEIFYIVSAGILILIGLAGTLLPLLPGPPLALAGLILYGWASGFETVSATVLVVFGILTALTFVSDIFTPVLAARGYKSSGYGALGAVLGALFGIFIFGPIGAVIGPLIGAFIGELFAKADAHRALRTAWGAFVGVMIGTVFKVAVILGMLGYYFLGIFRAIL